MATILVVDDEFGISEVLASVLTDAGHTVVTAINGRQGLDRLKEARPHLVLLDFMMPVLDGPAMLRIMRNDPETESLPVVMMSSLPEPSIQETMNGMYSAFVRKPFKLRVVTEMVERILKETSG